MSENWFHELNNKGLEIALKDKNRAIYWFTRAFDYASGMDRPDLVQIACGALRAIKL